MTNRNVRTRPRIAIVIEIFALPGEKGYSRFHDIAKQFAVNGYEVDVLCSTFIHADKSKRPRGAADAAEVPYNVIEFDEPGYQQNVSFKRIWSQFVFSRKLKRYFETRAGMYDCVYSTMPDNYTALVATKYANRNKIPIVVDIEDLLPESFYKLIDLPVISTLLFSPWNLTAEAVYKRVDGVVGSSDEYRNRAFVRDPRPQVPRETVYVGINLSEFDALAKRSRSTWNKPKDEFWVAYTGTFGISYALDVLMDAVAILHSKGYSEVKLKLAGGGPLEADLRRHALSLGFDDDVFLGYQAYGDMAALLVESDVAVNALAPKVDASIINKVGDYMAGSCPIVNCFTSEEFGGMIVGECIGINVEPGNAAEIADAIERLYLNPDLRSEMSVNARALAKRSFDRAISYPRIVSLMNSLLEKR